MSDYKKIKNWWDEFLSSESLWVDDIISEQLKINPGDLKAAADSPIVTAPDRDKKREENPELSTVPGASTACPSVTPNQIICPIERTFDKIAKPSAGGKFHTIRGSGKHAAVDIGKFGDPVYAIAKGKVFAPADYGVSNDIIYIKKLLYALQNLNSTPKSYAKKKNQKSLKIKLYNNDEELKWFSEGFDFKKLLYITKITQGDKQILSGTFRKLLDQRIGKGNRRSIAAGANVWIYHPKLKLYSVYMHLKNVDEALKNGTVVEQGQKIGEVGKTGIFDPPKGAGRPHLHFELRCGSRNNAVDPRDVYTKSEWKN